MEKLSGKIIATAPDRGNGIRGYVNPDAGLNDPQTREKFLALLMTEQTYGSPKRACEILGISYNTAMFHRKRDADLRWYWTKAAAYGKKLKHKKTRESLEKIAFEGAVEIVYKDEKTIEAQNLEKGKTLVWNSIDDLYELSKDPDNISYVKRVLGSVQFAALKELLNQQHLDRARKRDKDEASATDTLLRELFVAATQRGFQIESPEQLRGILLKVLDKMHGGENVLPPPTEQIDAGDEKEILLASGEESLLD